MSVVEDEIAKLTEGFTGCEWVFEEIDHWLKRSNERFLILTRPTTETNSTTSNFSD